MSFRRITRQGFGLVPSAQPFPQLVELLTIAELHAARGVAVWERHAEQDETGSHIRSAYGLFTYRGRDWSWRLVEWEAPVVVALEIHGPMDLARYPLIVHKQWRLRRAAA